MKLPPIKRHSRTCLRCLFRAICGLTHRSKTASLFDYFVGATEQGERKCKAKRVCGFEIEANSTFTACTTGNSAGFAPRLTSVIEPRASPFSLCDLYGKW